MQATHKRNKYKFKKSSLLVIDWISTPSHKNFNESFMSCLSTIEFKLIVFHKELYIKNANCTLVERANGRLKSALQVLSFVRNSDHPILLITYDPLFVLLLKPFHNLIYLYEHNTVPETIYSKHAWFQLLFFRNFRRLTQYPVQIEALQILKQNATYVGSPLLCPNSIRLPNNKNRLSHIIFAPGARANISTLSRFAKILYGFTIFAKSTETLPNFTVTKLHIICKDYLDFPTKQNNHDLDAIIVTSEGKYRGSGWFNDAISYGVPIIITNAENQRIFSETFTKCKYIDLCEVESLEALKKMLLSKEYTLSPSDIIEHNAKIKTRLNSLFSSECGK